MQTSGTASDYQHICLHLRVQSGKAHSDRVKTCGGKAPSWQERTLTRAPEGVFLHKWKGFDLNLNDIHPQTEKKRFTSDGKQIREKTDSGKNTVCCWREKNCKTSRLCLWFFSHQAVSNVRIVSMYLIWRLFASKMDSFKGWNCQRIIFSTWDFS